MFMVRKIRSSWPARSNSATGGWIWIFRSQKKAAAALPAVIGHRHIIGKTPS